MRKHTLGESQWHAIGKRKVQLAAGKFVPVSQLMLLVSELIVFILLVHELLDMIYFACVRAQ